MCLFCGVLIFKLLCFLFYINDLPESIKITLNQSFFADDTSKIISNRSPIDFKKDIATAFVPSNQMV